MSDLIQATIISAVVAVVTGVLSSYLFWLWLTKRLRPRIVWSKHISVNEHWLGGPPKYRVKIQNVGRRAAVDFGAICMLRVPGVATGENVKLVKLRTLDVPLPFLGKGKGRLITIKTDGLDQFHVLGLPEPLRSRLNQEPPVTLEDLFADFPGSEVMLYLSAYDAVSGTRCHFQSVPYTSSSLTRKWFEPGSVAVQSGGPV
ncbi:hypothetical protein [Arthrobacter sp. S39]|uniref:hypothetical protein n=1 Tax=Arthrobacter sp. S39 TaxID=2509720 RepID=UPI0010374132|nr:hypothetical protein [Arthrobacter sp. S39]TAP39583.1 hypothetical protein EYS21_21685 [Arthrobacter sp. S39]